MSDAERPLAVDLFSGLGGWAQGLIAAGWRVRAYDIEDMYAATGATMHDHYELILRDVLDIHGSEIADAQLIVSSSPCTEYSYMAMPWSLAKAKRAAILADETGEAKRKLNELFDAQFRIQREACEAAGRHIPMVVENVRGAQEWVGRAAGSYGSYYLWGDVPAMLPEPVNGRKVPGFRFDGVSKKCFQQEAADRMAIEQFPGLSPDEGRKTKGMNWSDRSLRGQDFTRICGMQAGDAVKVPSSPGYGRRTDPGEGARFTSRDCGVEAAEGRKGASGAWFNDSKGKDNRPAELLSMSGSKSPSRKAASAKIAKIPLTLSRYIGKVFHPDASDKTARAREIDMFSDWG